MLQYLSGYDFYAYEEVCSYLGINKLKYGNHNEVKSIILKDSLLKFFVYGLNYEGFIGNSRLDYPCRVITLNKASRA